jgi:hypothetical protein
MRYFLAAKGICDRGRVWVKGFADACYKGEEDVAKGITYLKDREDR